MTKIELLRQVREFIRHPYTRSGCYPKLLVMSDGATLCAECARSNYRQISSDTRQIWRGGWSASDVVIHWEGPAECCAHCGAETESAYGEEN